MAEKDAAMKTLLMDARHEILNLRRRNEILSAQVAVVEVFEAALGLNRNGGGMSVDVAWELQQAIDKMESAPAHKQE